jgi:hypothetical protein
VFYISQISQIITEIVLSMKALFNRGEARWIVTRAAARWSEWRSLIDCDTRRWLVV